MTPPHTGPVALLLACLVSGILVPVPEDVALLVAGWQVREGTLSPGGAVIAGLLGTFGRDALAFSAGRLAVRGARRWAPLARLLESRRVRRLRERLDARGDTLLFAARFMVGVRAPLYFAGGTTDRPFRRFALYDLVGLTVTTPLLLGLGWRWGPEAAAWLQVALGHQRLVLAVVVAGAVLWSTLFLRARRRRAAAE